MKLKNQFRAISATDMAVDKEKRTIEFPFSSEYPVERFFGTEVLSHEQRAADLTRLNDGAALLWNHNSDVVIGVVERAELKADKRLWATARFSENPKAQEVLKDIEDGILRNVSFGYQIKEMELKNPGAKNQEPEYLATRWLPFEVSIVSVPADPTVGIGRADGDEPTEVKITNKGPDRAGVKRMDEEQKRIEAEKQRAAVEAATRDSAKAERERIATINALGDKFGNTDLSRQLVEGGKTIEEARAAFIEKMGAAQKPLTGNEGVVGMTEKEVRDYSFLRAIRALANPTDRQAQEAAKFEREASDAAAKRSGKESRGMMVPYDVLSRDLSVGTATAGGNLVATNLLAASFIELLRKKSVLQAAGATMMNGLVGNIAIPKQSSASTAYWVAEAGAPTESQQAVAQVSMSPKTVGAYTDYSRKLLIQSSLDVESFVRNDLAAVIALEIDRVGLYGTGSSNQPQGIKAALSSGAQESNFAAAIPTFAEIIALETAVASANGDIGAMKYLINATMRGSLKSAVKVSGYPSFILESDGSMNGYAALVSNQVAAGDVFFGVWNQLLMGFWSGLDLMVDPYSQSTTGSVRVVALQDVDMAIRHSEAFARGNDTP